MHEWIVELESSFKKKNVRVLCLYITEWLTQISWANRNISKITVISELYKI